MIKRTIHVITLLALLLCSACVSSDEERELKSPCVSYSAEKEIAPCQRRPVNLDIS
jgi:hypothetical protein